MDWIDSTSYSNSQKERVQTAWTAKTGSLAITITKGHIYYKGNWVMHCFAVGMDTIPMVIPADATPEQAQRMAVDMVRAKVEIYLAALETK